MGSTTAEEVFSLPSWLNEEFLTFVLTKAKDDEISVINFDAKAAVPRGDNYLSTLYRIIVRSEAANGPNGINHDYLIVKTPPAGDIMQKFLEDLKGFEKEVTTYQNILPKMYEIMKGIYGEIRPLSAQCFPCEVDGTLVLEDLQHLGYRMGKRQEGLDLDHCKVAVRGLARFHATSLAIYNEDPTSMDVFEETFYVSQHDKKDLMEKHFDSNISTLASKVEKWPGFEHYAEKLRNLIPVALDTMVGFVTPKEGGFNVLNHGDCWVNNMLFKYNFETGKVEDVRLIDFQIARFASPVLDLQYFIVNSGTDDVRFEHRDIVLEEYHDELSNTLQDLNLDPSQYTLEDLKEEFEEKEKFGLLTACTVMCAVLAQKDAAPDLSELKEEHLENGAENMMDKAYSGSRYREVFQKFLLHYDRKGLL